MGDDNDKDFYREVLKLQIELQRDGNKAIAKQNDMLLKQNGILEEIKISLQGKPCIVEEVEKELNKGWKDTSLSLYRWVISGLFIIIIGILAGVGLFDKTILKLMK